MNKPKSDSAAYYEAILKNPLLTPLSDLPEGEALKKKLGHLPLKPDDEVRRAPAAHRLTYLSELRTIHVPLGRDMQLAAMIFELIRDGYLSRSPTPEVIQRRATQASTFAKSITSRKWSVADYEAVGAALIGMSGTGKTRTLKRILRLIKQVIEHDLEKDPLLPAKMITYIRVECPSNHTHTALIASIFAAIENAIGEPLPDGIKRGNLSMLAQNVANVCLDFCVGLLIIDEIQHILRRDGEPEPQLLNFLVELSNKLEIPILLVGTPLAQKVVARQMRQARRMLGPEWSNLAKDGKPWKDFITKLWDYQFTREFTPYEKVADKFYELTQGVPALAVTLFRLAQRYAIDMEAPGKKVFIGNELLAAVAEDHFKPVAPMVLALASGNPERIGLYEDLKLDAQIIEDEMIENLRQYREQCRVRLLSTTTAAFRKARKTIKAGAALEAAALAKGGSNVPATAKIMAAYANAKANGKDPAEAVDEATKRGAA